MINTYVGKLAASALKLKLNQTIKHGQETSVIFN